MGGGRSWRGNMRFIHQQQWSCRKLVDKLWLHCLQARQKLLQCWKKPSPGHGPWSVKLCRRDSLWHQVCLEDRFSSASQSAQTHDCYCWLYILRLLANNLRHIRNKRYSLDRVSGSKVIYPYRMGIPFDVTTANELACLMCLSPLSLWWWVVKEWWMKDEQLWSRARAEQRSAYLSGRQPSGAAIARASFHIE